MDDVAVARYRKIAEECLDMAAQAKNPNNRERLQRLAEVWLSLASDELTQASEKSKQLALPI